jgi:alpha-D-ribose 1-methylphosphonate 5-phosphate C-P lyase
MSNFAQVVGAKYLGQWVDIYFGDNKGNRFYAEEEKTKLTFMRGQITSYDDDLLILQCIAVEEDAQNGSKAMAITYEVCINTYNVKAISPVEDFDNFKFSITKLMMYNPVRTTAHR